MTEKRACETCGRGVDPAQAHAALYDDRSVYHRDCIPIGAIPASISPHEYGDPEWVWRFHLREDLTEWQRRSLDHALVEAARAVRSPALPCPERISELSEREFQARAEDALESLGWTVVHIDNMGGNTPGVPDLLCFRGEQGVMIELKVGSNNLSNAQRRWAARARRQGTHVYLVRNTPEGWEDLMNLANGERHDPQPAGE